MHARRTHALIAAMLALVLAAAAAIAATDAPAQDVEGYPGVQRKPVTIWSDGTRLAGDLFLPKGLAAGQKVPAIVLCHGWGGMKSHLNQRIAPQFSAAGFAVLTFDYRGWGESDGRLVVRDAMPKPVRRTWLVAAFTRTLAGLTSLWIRLRAWTPPKAHATPNASRRN